jgi:hypothetical protein
MDQALADSGAQLSAVLQLNERQVSPMRKKCCRGFVGAGLPAILRVWESPLTGAIRQQAGSYRAPGFLYLQELACRRIVA